MLVHMFQHTPPTLKCYGHKEFDCYEGNLIVCSEGLILAEKYFAGCALSEIRICTENWYFQVLHIISCSMFSISSSVLYI